MTILPVLIFVLLLAVIWVFYYQPFPLIQAIARLSPRVLYFVRTYSKSISLTIDDGPHSEVTPQILDILRECSAKATFFIIGERVRGNEAILERIRREGHEVGNHLMRDYPSILLRKSEFERQLVEADKIIRPAGFLKWFRPGSGWHNRRMLDQIERHGYSCALASIYPHDTFVRNSRIISRYILSRIAPGAIIVIHDGSEDRIRTVEVLRIVLPVLKQKGYEVLTLSELVATASEPEAISALVLRGKAN